MPKKIMVSAMEVSADFHLSHLISAVKIKDSTVEFYGAAGHNCKAQGVQVFFDLTNKSTIGFIEPLQYLPSLLINLWKAKKLLRETSPDCLLLVDGQGFNLPLAKLAKKLRIPVVYYISPQEWQWGTEEGGRKVLACVDVILSLFKDEAAFYNRLGGTAYWHGHALRDIVKPRLSKEAFCQKHKLDPQRPIIGLFPGSRKQELSYLLPVIYETARRVKLQVPEAQFVFSAATPFSQKLIAAQQSQFPVLSDQNYDIMAHCDLIITATGTATLEAACLYTPMIALYKFSPLSYWLIKKLVGRRIPKYAALPNIWLDKMAVPEFIQHGVEASLLAGLVVDYLYNPQLLAEMKTELKKLDPVLGPAGALAKNAQIIINLLQQPGGNNNSKK